MNIKTFLAALFCAFVWSCSAQTNTIIGSYTDYYGNPQAGQGTISLISPVPRQLGTNTINPIMEPFYWGSNGIYSFNNLPWGQYNLVFNGNQASLITIFVQTNTLGLVQISTLTTNANNFPPPFVIIGTNGVNITSYAFTGQTNWPLAFSSTITPTYQIPQTNGVMLTYSSGNCGSISFYLTNTPVSYPVSWFWLTKHPMTVTNGLVSLTAYGSIVAGAYSEFQ